MVCNMVYRMYATYDAKLAVYGTPIFDKTDASMIRAFSDAVNKPGTGFYEHPEDYSLWYFGEFDNDTGEFDLDKPKNLISAASLKNPGYNPVEQNIAVS